MTVVIKDLAIKVCEKLATSLRKSFMIVANPIMKTIEKKALK